MISRVAENCFWLGRYIERAESTAQLVSVNRMVILDAQIHEAARWKPLIASAGEQARFEDRYGAAGYDSDRDAETYLTWDEANPGSVRSSVRAARENARMTREVLSREMWETLNTVWQWLDGADARKLYRKDRAEFHGTIRRMAAELRGEAETTMLHEQPYHFLRFGSFLEQADQSVRVLAIKQHWGGDDGEIESAEESAQWTALLRLCAAIEPFFKRHSAAPSGALVYRFLLQDPGFPRAVLSCLQRAESTVQKIEKVTGRDEMTQTRKLLTGTLRRVASARPDRWAPEQLATEVNHLLGALAAVGQAAHDEFFDPALPSKR